jgi:hypothetical protein
MKYTIVKKILGTKLWSTTVGNVHFKIAKALFHGTTWPHPHRQALGINRRFCSNTPTLCLHLQNFLIRTIVFFCIVIDKNNAH